MKTKKSTGKFEDTTEFQTKYNSLLSACEAVGTMILQDRVLEIDKDTVPYQFFRKGTREYVFPRQDATLENDESRVIDPNPDYRLDAQKQTFRFDESKVKARIRIEYEDSKNRPTLEIVDVLGDSKLPKKVQRTIDNIF